MMLVNLNIVHLRNLILDLSTSTTHEKPSTPKYPGVEPKEGNATALERDPGLHLQIWQHPVNQRDEI